MSLFTWIEKHSVALACGLIVVVLAAGTGYSIYLGDQLRFFPDELDYVTLAENLARRFTFSLDGVNPSAFRAPGYPFFLAALNAIGLTQVGYRMANFVILGMTLWVVYTLLARSASRLAGVIGVLLILAYPVVFYTAGTFYPQTLAGLLFLLALWIFSEPQPPEWAFLLTGLTWGALILTVPNFLVTFVLLVGWAVYHWRGRYGGVFKMLAAAVLVVSLWGVRNILVLDALFLISTNVGDNLIRSYSENVTPNSGPTVDVTAYTDIADRMGEVERNRYLSVQAFQYIAAHPLHVMRLYALKVLNYFNYRNELKTASEGSLEKDVLMGVTYGGLLCLGTARLLLWRGRWAGKPLAPPTRFAWLLLVVYLANAFIGALFFNRIRYRIPFDYLLILWVALFLDGLFSRSRITQGKNLP